MMHYFFGLFLTFLFITGGYAQKISPYTLTTSGNSTATQLNFAIGEVLVTSKNISLRLTDGYLQPGKQNVVTGINADYEVEVTIYPNPTEEYIIIKSYSTIKTICIESLTEGKKIDLMSVKPNTFDVSLLPSGTYLITLFLKSQPKTYKFVKL